MTTMMTMITDKRNQAPAQCRRPWALLCSRCTEEKNFFTICYLKSPIGWKWKCSSCFSRSFGFFFTCSCPEARSRFICSENRYLVGKILPSSSSSSSSSSPSSSPPPTSSLSSSSSPSSSPPGVLLLQLAGVRHIEFHHKSEHWIDPTRQPNLGGYKIHFVQKMGLVVKMNEVTSFGASTCICCWYL